MAQSGKPRQFSQLRALLMAVTLVQEGTNITEHRPRFHRSQLIFIAEQNQPSVLG
ncbi:Uncharacterised protein [Vibrio cholerae]|nr:Uncharacterised protein [Vibrio cholerae]